LTTHRKAAYFLRLCKTDIPATALLTRLRMTNDATASPEATIAMRFDVKKIDADCFAAQAAENAESHGTPRKMDHFVRFLDS